MSDLQNARDGIDSLDEIIVKVRVRSSTGGAVTDPTLIVFWGLGAVQYGNSAHFIAPSGTTFANYELTYPHWNAALQTKTVAQLQNLYIAVLTDYRAVEDPSNTVLIELDTLEVEIVWSPPPPITRFPDEAVFTLSPKSLVATQADFIATPAESLVLSLKTGNFARHDIQRPDPRALLLQPAAPQLDTGFAIAQRNLVLTGRVPVSGYSLPGIEGGVQLAGKVPTLSRAFNQTQSVPFRRLRLASVEININDEVEIPPQNEASFVGKVPVLAIGINHRAEPGAGTLALAGTAPLVGKGYIVTDVALQLAGAAPLPRAATPHPAGSLALSGQAPAVFGPVTQLVLSGYSVTVNLVLPMPVGALTTASFPPIVESVPVPAGSMALAGKAGPTLKFQTTVIAGDHSIMSVTSRYDVEHVGTPAEETIE